MFPDLAMRISWRGTEDCERRARIKVTFGAFFFHLICLASGKKVCSLILSSFFPLSKVFSIETGDGRGPFFARSRPSRRKVLLEEPCAFAITIIMLLLGLRITRTFLFPVCQAFLQTSPEEIGFRCFCLLILPKRKLQA